MPSSNVSRGYVAELLRELKKADLVFDHLLMCTHVGLPFREP
jgi:hypothetical protein